MQASAVAVTRGRQGALMVIEKPKPEVCRVPALTKNVVDRIGAGDAFLALTGLCMGGHLDEEVSLLVGSAAAALDVQIVCNREAVNSVALHKYLTTLLK